MRGVRTMRRPRVVGLQAQHSPGSPEARTRLPSIRRSTSGDCRGENMPAWGDPAPHTQTAERHPGKSKICFMSDIKLKVTSSSRLTF